MYFEHSMQFISMITIFLTHGAWFWQIENKLTEMIEMIDMKKNVSDYPRIQLLDMSHACSD